MVCVDGEVPGAFGQRVTEFLPSAAVAAVGEYTEVCGVASRGRIHHLPDGLEVEVSEHVHFDGLLASVEFGRDQPVVRWFAVVGV